MNANVIEFYQKVRVDPNLIDALSRGKTIEEFSEIAVGKAGEIGIQLEKSEVVNAAGQIRELVMAAANDDELTELELELVAAGIPMTMIKNDA